MEDGWASEKSEHIGILIDPRNSTSSTSPRRGRSGPTAATAGTRPPTAQELDVGLIKVSERTGITDVVMDPRNPDILSPPRGNATAISTALINGGPKARSTADRCRKELEEDHQTACRRGRSAASGWRCRPRSGRGRSDRRVGSGDAGIFRSVDGGATGKALRPYQRSPMYYGSSSPIRSTCIDCIRWTCRTSPEDGGATEEPRRTPKHVTITRSGSTRDSRSLHQRQRRWPVPDVDAGRN